MANYISSLTGVQMDTAMTDMANHISEAWAVGQRNGVDVSSGDATYHNNSKYYANQASTQIADGVARAEDAAARAEAAVPPSTAGAVFFDRAQSLTETQASQAKANIQVSNDNLLDNWYFVGGGSQLGEGVFPINQRGLTEYTDSGYNIDRWNKSSTSCTVTLLPDCIRLTATSTPIFRQYVGSLSGLYTFSVYMRGSGNISIRFYDSSSTSIKYSSTISLTNDWTLYSVTLDTVAEGTVNIAAVGFRPTNGVQADIQKVKLERGSVSTLLNDVPPNFGEELLRCITNPIGRTDSQAHTGYGRSNPNLCDNPFFTINQRGFTTYTASAPTYTVDRWLLTLNSAGTGTVTVSDDGLTIVNNYSGGYAYFVHRFDADMQKAIDGKVITMSVLYQDGTIKQGTGVFHLGTTMNIYADDGEIAMRIYSPTTDRAEPTIDIDASKTIAIRAVKVELGAYSTLISDALPNYAAELAKCQRYCQVYGRNGDATLNRYFAGFMTERANGRAVFWSPLLVEMRTNPTATNNGALGTRPVSSSTNLNGSVYTFSTSTTGIYIVDTNSNITTSEIYSCATHNSGNLLILSADL